MRVCFGGTQYPFLKLLGILGGRIRWILSLHWVESCGLVNSSAFPVFMEAWASLKFPSARFSFQNSQAVRMHPNLDKSHSSRKKKKKKSPLIPAEEYLLILLRPWGMTQLLVVLNWDLQPSFGLCALPCRFPVTLAQNNQSSFCCQQPKKLNCFFFTLNLRMTTYRSRGSEGPLSLVGFLIVIESI